MARRSAPRISSTRGAARSIPRPARTTPQGWRRSSNALEIASGHKPAEALGVEAIDAHTLEVRLTGPTPYLLDLLAQQYLYPVYGPAVRALSAMTGCGPSTWSATAPSCCARTCIGCSHHARKEPVLLGCGARAAAAGRCTTSLPDRAVQAARFLAGEVQWTDSFAANQRLLAQVTARRPGGQLALLRHLSRSGSKFKLPPFKDNPAAARRRWCSRSIASRWCAT